MTIKDVRIVADENILGLDQYFENLSELSFVINKLPGRSISNHDLHECDILLVRSVTQVNESLLHDTPVRFVGTATSGVEHIDIQYLNNNRIYFSHAQGANANAVAEYVVASIAYLCLQNQKNYFEKKIAIVGHGHVGKALEKKLKVLTSTLNIYDPLIKSKLLDKNEGKNYCEWQDVLSSELISLHVPYTEYGEFPTKDLLNRAFFKAINHDSVIINAARGEVCDEDALLEKLSKSSIKIVWDVWKNEPDISKQLLSKAALASPHIAGYSLDAKIKATEMLAKQVFDYLNITDKHESNKEKEFFYLNFDEKVKDIFDICRIILLAYNPELDTTNLRALTAMPLSEHFDELRRQYRHRYEWKHFNVSQLKVDAHGKMLLKNLGFYFEE